MNRKRKRYSVLLLATLILSACNIIWKTEGGKFYPTITTAPLIKPTLPQPSPTAKVQTFEKTPILVQKTATAVFTATSVIQTYKLPYKTLTRGQYVIYYTQGKIWYISMDGKYGGIFSERFEPIEFLQGGQKVFGVDLESHKFYFVNLVTDIAESVIPPEGDNCSTTPDPIKGKKILLWCRYDYQIYVIDEKGEKIQVSHPLTKNDYFINPQWSPDGQWISFYSVANLAIEEDLKSKNEFFLVPTACLSEKNHCKLAQKGPYKHNLLAQSDYAWSPNSNEIALLSSDINSPIQIWNIEKESFRTLYLTENKGSNITSLAWSPDGIYLAYTRTLTENVMYRIFLANVNSGKTMMIENGPEDATIKFWVTVP